MAPTEHLKTQWAEAAAKVGIPLDPTYSGRKGKASSDFVGVALTYAGVAANPLAHRIRTERFNTLVILDEVHHAGDALSWGEAVREAFDPARRRLALTGTPFRSDTAPIPFVSYAPDDFGIRTSMTDYAYGYSRALADGVVRPVLFHVYAGAMRWRGVRPTVRGVVMNPIDHPHGGGEGRTAAGRHPVSPWGQQTKGKKTRSNKRTSSMIVSRRGKK